MRNSHQRVGEGWNIRCLAGQNRKLNVCAQHISASEQLHIDWKTTALQGKTGKSEGDWISRSMDLKIIWLYSVWQVEKVESWQKGLFKSEKISLRFINLDRSTSSPLNFMELQCPPNPIIMWLAILWYVIFSGCWLSPNCHDGWSPFKDQVQRNLALYAIISCRQTHCILIKFKKI